MHCTVLILKDQYLTVKNGEAAQKDERRLPTLGRRMVCGGKKDVAEAGENNGVEEKRMSRRLERTTVEAVWEKREMREKEDEGCVEVWRLCAQRQIKDLAPRSKIPRVQAAGNLLYWGAFWVQCGKRDKRDSK